MRKWVWLARLYYKCAAFLRLSKGCGLPLTYVTTKFISTKRLNIAIHENITSNKNFILKYFRCRDGKRKETRYKRVLGKEYVLLEICFACK